MAKLSVKFKKKSKSIRLPKSVDEKYTGAEPKFDPSIEVNDQQMGLAYNYYNYHCDYSDSRKYLIAYLKANKYDVAVIQKIAELPETIHVPTVGWIARIMTNGAKINSISRTWFDTQLNHLIQHQPIAALQDGSKKPSIQDRMNAQFSRCVADIDEQIDLFMNDSSHSFDIKKYLHDTSVSGIVSSRISKHYQPLLDEFQGVLDRRDEQLREAYSSYSRSQMKKNWEFLNVIVSELNHQGHKSKVLRGTRKKKPKTVEQQVRKLKYMQHYKDLDLSSVNPSMIIGASQLWVYNTKTRKLGVYNSQDNGGLRIKGSTIISFDEKASVCKKLRKPEKVLVTVAQGGKIALRSVLDDVKAVASPLTGRVNGDTILVRVVK
jgi:hypothetical protein